MGKKGFTLAEVLITLGIIGVVAAMTMPTLITNVQNKIFYTRFMKARNMIENALQMYNSEYDKISDTRSFTIEDAEDFASYFKGAKFINESNWQEECAGYNKKNVSLNYDGTRNDEGTNANQMCHNSIIPLGLKTRDGMLIMFNQDLGYGNAGLVDTDGSNNGPNTMGRDIFAFDLYKEQRELFCNSMWGPTKACAEEKGFTQECTETNKNGEYCGQRLIEEGKMAY